MRKHVGFSSQWKVNKSNYSYIEWNQNRNSKKNSNSDKNIASFYKTHYIKYLRK